VVSSVLGLPIYDTQCGAKLFRCTPDLPELFARPFGSRWVFDVEIIARQIKLSRRNGGRTAAELIYEYPLEQWIDVPGSKLRALDFPRVLVDVYTIWRSLAAHSGVSERVSERRVEPRDS
jgi:hypothetical protein